MIEDKKAEKIKVIMEMQNIPVIYCVDVGDYHRTDLVKTDFDSAYRSARYFTNDSWHRNKGKKVTIIEYLPVGKTYTIEEAKKKYDKLMADRKKVREKENEEHNL